MTRSASVALRRGANTPHGNVLDPMVHPPTSGPSRSLLLALVASSTFACTPAHPPIRHKTALCPAEAAAPPLIPLARPEHLLADFWITRTSDPDRVLLDRVAVAAHNARVRTLAPPSSMVARIDLLEAKLHLPRARFTQDLDRLAKAISAGKRVRPDGRPPGELLAELRTRFAATRPVDELRVVLRSTPLRCYPDATPLYETVNDRAFDLAQCAELRFGEAVRVLGRGPLYVYVHAAYGAGWVRAESLSTPLDAAAARRYLRPEEPVVVLEDRVAVWSAAKGGKLLGVARLGLQLPLARSAAEGSAPAHGDAPLPVWVVGEKGLRRAYLRRRSALRLGAAVPLSRAALFDRAFRLLDTPYGWGGTGGQRDCSRVLMDVFASFGIELPRNSRQQSQSGTERVAVATLDEARKREAIEAAARRGVVLLYLPGHIMLYLGRDGDHLYALHQFSGYLTPCSGGGETMQRVNRTTVTALELGRGSSRRAFIERITQLVVFAPKAAPIPGGAAGGAPQASPSKSP